MVVQFDCHPEASVLCAAKDLGEPREASRSCDEIIARLARFLTKLHHQHRLRSCTHRSILVKIVVSGIIPHTSGGDTNSMTYVIAEPCIGTKDTACVDACPVDCIHPKKDEPAYAEEEMLYIDPVECIDCGACVPVCPVSAIFALDDLPEKWKSFTERNAKYYGR